MELSERLVIYMIKEELFMSLSSLINRGSIVGNSLFHCVVKRHSTVSRIRVLINFQQIFCDAIV